MKGIYMRRKKTIWIVAGAAVVAVSLYFALRPANDTEDNLVSRMDLTELASGDIEYTISGTGTVESSLSHKVYASQNFPVTEVLVEVGDMVSIGQELLLLDTKTLEEQIESRELSMTASERSAAQQVKAAEDNYRAARAAIDNDSNASLISAESSVSNAYDNWQKAIRTRDTYLDSKKDGLDTAVTNAKNARDSAEAALNAARTARNAADSALKNHDQSKISVAASVEKDRQEEFEAAQTAYENAASDLKQAEAEGAEEGELISLEAALLAAQSALDIARYALENAKSVTQAARAPYQTLQANLSNAAAQVTSAETAYNQAVSAHDKAVKEREDGGADAALIEYNHTIDAAHAAYQTALRSQAAAVESAQNALQQNRNSLASAQISANTDLAELEYERLLASLEDAKVVAEEAGTVTAVFANVGSAANGILFVIEDTEDLIVETTISGYDVGTIAVGMAVTIRSEASKDSVYTGIVTDIAPTSNKNVQGNTDRAGDPVFATKIKVTDADSDLRIGMTVRLDYIVEREEDVLTVSHDTVYVNEMGVESIMVIDGGHGMGAEALLQSGKAYLLRELPVVTALENDVQVAIGGDGITEGMVVVNNPANYRRLVGEMVVLTERIISSGDDSLRRMMFGF